MRIGGLDDFLARRTPGKLLLIFLMLLLAGAFVLSLLKLIEQKPPALLFTTALVSVTCLATNWAFAYVFGAKSKLESVIITSLILALIVSPAALAQVNPQPQKTVPRSSAADAVRRTAAPALSAGARSARITGTCPGGDVMALL